MMNRTELNLEETEIICGGKKATMKELKKKCKGNKFALQMLDFCEEVQVLLKDLGIDHDYNLEINE